MSWMLPDRQFFRFFQWIKLRETKMMGMSRVEIAPLLCRQKIKTIQQRPDLNSMRTKNVYGPISIRLSFSVKLFWEVPLSCCHEQCCHVHLAALQGMAIRDIARHKGGTRSGQEDTRHWPAMVKRVIDLLIQRSHSVQYISFLSFFPSYLERGYWSVWLAIAGIQCMHSCNAFSVKRNGIFMLVSATFKLLSKLNKQFTHIVKKKTVLTNLLHFGIIGMQKISKRYIFLV